MGVKIGKAMGCEVTVFTRSPSKIEDAERLGATTVVLSTDHDQMSTAKRSLEFIYNTVAFDHDIHPYLDCLKSRGTMILVGGVPKGAMPRGFFQIDRPRAPAGRIMHWRYPRHAAYDRFLR